MSIVQFKPPSNPNPQVDWDNDEHARWCAHHIQQCVTKAIQVQRQIEQAVYGMASENAYSAKFDTLYHSSIDLKTQLQAIYIEIRIHAAGILLKASQEQRHAAIVDYLHMDAQCSAALWLALLS
jgi:hypothetical protein